MPPSQTDKRISPSHLEDFECDEGILDTPQTRSPSFRPAYKDSDFLPRDELRPMRVHLELLKPELQQQEASITSTLVVFGSTRIPDRDSAEENLAEEKRKLATSKL